MVVIVLIKRYKSQRKYFCSEEAFLSSDTKRLKKVAGRFDSSENNLLEDTDN